MQLPSSNLEELIVQVMKSKMGEFLEEYIKEREIKLKEISLLERVIRVEEELKALKQLELERFEALYKEMNSRFEALERKFNFSSMVYGDWLFYSWNSPYHLNYPYRYF